MFGHDDNNQAVMGSPTVQNPSMLDNVNTSDFQTQDDASAAASAAPAPSSPTQDMMAAGMMGAAPVTPPTTDTPPVAAEPTAAVPATDEHQLTTDNPFIQDATQFADSTTSQDPVQTVDTPQSADTAPSEEPVVVAAEPAQQDVPAPTTSPSGPVDPPVVAESQDEITTEEVAEETQPDYIAALSGSNDNDTHPPIDHDKLADMKREALDHLEPLADHVGGTPEETFKTTMMMIQANDNHTLLEKALAAAKKIEDDKIRAQAMLDIINEINYFSQQG